MKLRSLTYHRALVFSCALLFAPAISAQTQPQKPAEQGDVIRVNTELVQTDVMVFDKKGHFVDGLTGDQFELKINGKQTPVSFFERVTSDRLANEKASSSSNTENATKSMGGATSTIVRGRTIIFFIDDLHLAPTSINRTRKALLDFIDRGMDDNDLVAIVSSSGQIGFLQQLTTDRFALRSAVARLNYRSGPGKQDMLSPPMSEYIATKIREGDEGTISMYVSEIMRRECSGDPTPGSPFTCTMSPQLMRQLVVERAQMITTQTAPDTVNTLALLEGLMRTAAQLPGRKLVFMISDGFYLSERTMASREKVRKVTDAAGRAGVVIYTLDARGLMGETLDVSNDRPMDGAGFTTGLTGEHIAASQDGLNALAGDTGGRAFRNTNGPMAEWVGKMLDETANYYLLAWRPDTEEQKRGKFNHIEMSIIGRPDLTVRLRDVIFQIGALTDLVRSKGKLKKILLKRAKTNALSHRCAGHPNSDTNRLGLKLAQMPGSALEVIASVEINLLALSFDLKDGKELQSGYWRDLLRR